MATEVDLSDRHQERTPEVNSIVLEEVTQALVNSVPNSEVNSPRFMEILAGTFPGWIIKDGEQKRAFTVRTLQEIAAEDSARKNEFLASPLIRGSEPTWKALVSAVQLVLTKHGVTKANN